MKDQQMVERLTSELEGIIDFADGFACYHTSTPAGLALREFINGARAAVADARSELESTGNER